MFGLRQPLLCSGRHECDWEELAIEYVEGGWVGVAVLRCQANNHQYNPEEAMYVRPHTPDLCRHPLLGECDQRL